MNCCHQCHPIYFRMLLLQSCISYTPAEELEQPVYRQDAHVATTKVKLLFDHFDDDFSQCTALLFLKKEVCIWSRTSFWGVLFSIWTQVSASSYHSFLLSNFFLSSSSRTHLLFYASVLCFFYNMFGKRIF